MITLLYAVAIYLIAGLSSTWVPLARKTPKTPYEFLLHTIVGPPIIVLSLIFRIVDPIVMYGCGVRTNSPVRPPPEPKPLPTIAEKDSELKKYIDILPALSRVVDSWGMDNVSYKDEEAHSAVRNFILDQQCNTVVTVTGINDFEIPPDMQSEFTCPYCDVNFIQCIPTQLIIHTQISGGGGCVFPCAVCDQLIETTTAAMGKGTVTFTALTKTDKESDW